MKTHNLTWAVLAVVLAAAIAVSWPPAPGVSRILCSWGCLAWFGLVLQPPDGLAKELLVVAFAGVAPYSVQE